MAFLRDTNIRSWWTPSYISDYIIILSTFFALIMFSVLAEPYRRHSPDFTPILDYPYHKNAETIPNWLLTLIGIILPICFLLVAVCITRSIHQFHSCTLAFAFAQAITGLATELAKLYVGRLRPDWFSEVSESATEDGRKSYFSGHSSTSFCSMVFVSLYIAGRLKMYHGLPFGLLRVIISLLPICLAMWVGFSRIADFAHHASDVNAGAIVGSSCAIVAYFTYYPSLFSKNCNLPHNIAREKKDGQSNLSDDTVSF